MDGSSFIRNWFGQRYYNPSQGRFFGRDPKEEKGGKHLYAFVRNDPANKWDYLGMEEIIKMAAFTVTASRISGGTTYTTGMTFGATGSDFGYGPTTSDNSGGGEPSNQPTRWSAKDCINVGTLITYYDDSLSDFRKTHHGSYVNDRSLAAAQADADFQSRYGTTIGDFVTDAVGWTGVASFVIGLAADATGRAAIMDAGIAIDSVVNGFSHPAAVGLGANDLNDGNTQSAVSNFAGAGGNIVSLLINGAKIGGTASKVIPLWGQVLSAGSAAIFTADFLATRQIKTSAAREITESYAKLEKMEEDFVAKLDGVQSDWDKHCK